MCRKCQRKNRMNPKRGRKHKQSLLFRLSDLYSIYFQLISYLVAYGVENLTKYQLLPIILRIFCFSLSFFRIFYKILGEICRSLPSWIFGTRLIGFVADSIWEIFLSRFSSKRELETCLLGCSLWRGYVNFRTTSFFLFHSPSILTLACSWSIVLLILGKKLPFLLLCE